MSHPLHVQQRLLVTAETAVVTTTAATTTIVVTEEVEVTKIESRRHPCLLARHHLLPSTTHPLTRPLSATPGNSESKAKKVSTTSTITITISATATVVRHLYQAQRRQRRHQHRECPRFQFRLQRQCPLSTASMLKLYRDWWHLHNSSKSNSNSNSPTTTQPSPTPRPLLSVLSIIIIINNISISISPWQTPATRLVHRSSSSSGTGNRASRPHGAPLCSHLWPCWQPVATRCMRTCTRLHCRRSAQWRGAWPRCSSPTFAFL